jgi:hypothetical protein
MSAPCRLPNNFGEASLLGIWASGLALSAQYGVRDNNESKAFIPFRRIKSSLIPSQELPLNNFLLSLCDTRRFFTTSK